MSSSNDNSGFRSASRSSGPDLDSSKLLLLMGSLLIVAFLLRVWGLGFGLPQRYHIDEIFYVALALKLPTNNFDMGITTHGPNLFYMILLGEYVLYFLSALLSGKVSSIAAFEQLYRNDPSNFVLLARLTSVVAGTLTLVAIYLLGKKLYRSRLIGLTAAVLLGFTFQHVRESHYGTPDVFVALLVTFCLLSCVNMLREGRYRDYILSGSIGGLAAGTKLTNGLIWVPILGAHLYQVWTVRAQRFWLKELILSPRLWTAVGAFLISFAAAYPNLVLRPHKFLEYLRFLVGVGQNGFIPQFIIEPSPAWFYYLYTLRWGMGWLILAMVVLGVWLALRRRDPAELMLLAFVVIYFLFLARSPYYASRYLLPILPVLLVLAAHAVLWLADSAARLVPLSRGVLLASILLVLLVQPFAYGIRHNLLLGKEDTRTMAKRWIEDHIPEHTAIAVDWRYHAPPLRAQNEAFPESSPQYRLVEAGGIGLPEQSVETYKAEGIDYIVVSSFIDDLTLSNAEDRQKRSSFHKALAEQPLVYEITPYTSEAPAAIFDQIFGPVTALWQIERPGPSIQIYQLGP